jgi:4'-phosphopantetheinyl transferase
MSDDLWRDPASQLMLSGAEIHLWRAALDPSPDQLTTLAQVLSPEERKRADRFYFERHRRRFTVARGVLRSILARYLQVQPETIEFVYGNWGKPSLAKSMAAEGLSFNLSHSGELALLALTRHRPIGVDIEWVERKLDIEGVARYSFSAQEVAILLALPAQEQPAAFFRCWTRKEAFIKATGEGISFGLDAFDVSLAPREPARLLEIRGGSTEAADWSLRELAPGPGYEAAVAVEGAVGDLACWQWPAFNPQSP